MSTPQPSRLLAGPLTSSSLSFPSSNLAGLDVNARDKYEWTPLYRAAYNGHVEAVKTLLELGADRTLRDEKVGVSFVLNESNPHPIVFWRCS